MFPACIDKWSCRDPSLRSGGQIMVDEGNKLLARPQFSSISDN